MSRLNFPDDTEKYEKESWTDPNTGLVFKYDGSGWTKQILSGNVVLELADGTNVLNRLLPDKKEMSDDEMLVYDDIEGWVGKNEIDGGTY